MDLFGGGDDAPLPAPPVVTPPPVMPIPDDAAMKALQKKKLAQRLQTSGRSSTILTGSDELLGG